MRNDLRALSSLGEAFLHVSALATTISIPLELIITKRPSTVKSMFVTDPETWSLEVSYQSTGSREHVGAVLHYPSHDRYRRDGLYNGGLKLARYEKQNEYSYGDSEHGPGNRRVILRTICRCQSRVNLHSIVIPEASATIK